MKVSFFAFLLCMVITAADSRTCSHVPPKPHEIIYNVHLEAEHIVKKRSPEQPLRIKLFYDDSVYKLSAEKYDYIDTVILPRAVEYWEKALIVRKTESVIRLNRKCEKNQVFLIKGDPHPYCNHACEPTTMCGEVQVPEDHLNECRVCNSLGHSCRVEGSKAGRGIPEADFVFYISALETERCRKGFTVAYAAHCQQESALDRPIAGHANLCPSSISLEPQELSTILSTVKHEILHALGFSVSLFAFYRDDNGNPLTDRTENGKPILNEQLQARQWSDRVIKSFYRTNWLVRGGNITKNINMIVTPRVVEEVRKHFNCSELEGAELEDQGHEGTALTHWEKRVFENEAMTGTHTQNPIYSRVTLALMEDTGWYRANYEMAQPLKWGAGLGCVFAQHSCKAYMDFRSARGESIHPYCNKVKRDPLETECTEDRNSVALCNLIHYPSSLPPKYQNFDSIPHISSHEVDYYGGSVSLADFCPYIQEFTWKSKDIVVRGSHCKYSENTPGEDRNFALESYTSDSKCFNHVHEWTERNCEQLRQWHHWGSGCYEYMCSKGRLHILVANHTYSCFYKDQVIEIEIYQNGWLHQGALICPDCREICEVEGMKCKSNIKAFHSISYPKDHLICASAVLQFSSFMLLSFLVMLRYCS